MRNFSVLGLLLLLQYLLLSCTPSKAKIIQEKNNCYNEKLTRLRKNPLYENVLIRFKDTFETLKMQKEFFGVPEYVANQIDSAVFFNKDSSECMLIVLQKAKDTALIFGRARIIYGSYKSKKWVFQPGMDKMFSKDFFRLYEANSFKNISKVARSSILTDGDVVRRGCEIDDYYWFVHLKN